MTGPLHRPLLLLALPLLTLAVTGCDVTKSYRLKHPTTGEVQSCTQWRGEQPAGARDDVWTCIREYQGKGYTLVDPAP